MNKYLKPVVGFLVISFCIFMGCEKKEEKGQKLEPVQFMEALEAETEPGQSSDETVQSDEAQEGSREDPVEVTEYVVHVCGAVENPGVYTLLSGSRIYQAVEAAGGFTPQAEEDYLNQADLVCDGMKIYVPTLEEVGEADWQDFLEQSLEQVSPAEKSGLVNINTADEELLCTLQGVGSSKAKSIISYRETYGAYQKIEDIMNVEGIKEGLFQKIKDSITV